MPEPRSPGDAIAVFRLPPLAYLVVVLLLFGSVPLAFTQHGNGADDAVVGWQTFILVVPLLAAVFIARTATIADGEGLTLRAAFGRRRFSWDEIRGLSVTDRSVYAVLADGSVRLPCVNVGDLGALSRASAGRLPELADPTPKFAPHRRRGRSRR